MPVIAMKPIKLHSNLFAALPRVTLKYKFYGDSQSELMGLKSFICLENILHFQRKKKNRIKADKRDGF